MEETERVILGITMGDPAGIGPEITVKALAQPGLYEICRPLVIGDVKIMEEAARIAGHPEIRIHPVASPDGALFRRGTIDVLDMKLRRWQERLRSVMLRRQSAWRWIMRLTVR